MTVTRRSVLIASTAAPAVGARSGRHVVPLCDGWRFALVNPGGITDPTGAYTDAADPRAVRIGKLGIPAT
ncbi:putative secreted protein [Streptomyces davaonensis JCM 4913]|uniref:Putative secreted protein n=1 Tax=Streptomyces davaonensis (strain DSM 101723 / JCM 4913 / KCC S-0913 / 768) TaxID=1214101 RepID=K4QWN0_STRDJ|nr:putative secreted protein [Streptomyces davaonensis JCM 4913]